MLKFVSYKSKGENIRSIHFKFGLLTDSLTETRCCTVEGKELCFLGFNCICVLVVSNGWVITAAKSPAARPLQKLMVGITAGEKVSGFKDIKPNTD